MEESTAKHGDLRVWHIPQVPGKPFIVNVANVVEGKLLLNALAEYDLFQLKNKIKPDYASAAGLSVFDATDKYDGSGGSWIDWYSLDDGEGIETYTLESLRISFERIVREVRQLFKETT